jgi:hypothetical protein|tara:strand:+ start:257 stop:484 length:228 start_codon:yes stop_codon:yes gene_type:complete
MTLAEQMQMMMDELRAIKHMNNSIKAQMEENVSLEGVKKVATLINMVDNLVIPDVVSFFEDVDDMGGFREQGGVA